MIAIENFMLRSFKRVNGVNISSYYVWFIAKGTILILCSRNPTVLWFCLRELFVRNQLWKIDAISDSMAMKKENSPRFLLFTSKPGEEHTL